VNELIAVLVAVAAAITFGASDVLEQRATHEVAERKLLDPRLFADLLATRLWVIGIVVDISASGLQAVALHFGPLSLVQPILVCDLLFAALMAAAVAHRRPDRIIVAGSCAALAAWRCSRPLPARPEARPLSRRRF
jgi:hypothetical protein